MDKKWWIGILVVILSLIGLWFMFNKNINLSPAFKINNGQGTQASWQEGEWKTVKLCGACSPNPTCIHKDVGSLCNQNNESIGNESGPLCTIIGGEVCTEIKDEDTKTITTYYKCGCYY